MFRFHMTTCTIVYQKFTYWFFKSHNGVIDENMKIRQSEKNEKENS